MLTGLIVSLRPKQWTKNALVFAGYLFTIQQGHSITEFLRAVAAFGIFCGVSGATYIINDVVDAKADRKHPSKCRRPIASGALPVPVAIMLAVLMLGAGLYGAFRLGQYFLYSTAAYLLLTLSYSAVLKHVVIVDVLSLAAGFVIRAAAGAVVINVRISPWLLLCTTLLALFLGLAKRRSELLTLEDGHQHRKTLGQYSAPMLDQMLGISASATLMAYCLYTFSPSPITGQSHVELMATIPFVVYGLFRYLFLIQSRNAGESPELVLLEDKPMLLNMVLYIVAVAVALKL